MGHGSRSLVSAGLGVLVAASLLAGCARGPTVAARVDAAEGQREVRDGMGRTLRVPQTVRRVVSLAPSTTEVLYAVGAGPLLVGIDAFSDYPPAVASIEKVGGNIDPSLERLLSLRPDVVLAAKSANPQRTVEAMERLGLSVYVCRSESLADVLADVRAIGAVVGRAAEGERLAATLEARIAAVRARVAGAPRTRALVVVWPQPLTVAGKNNHVDELITTAGGENAAASSPQPYPTYGLEALLAQAPQVIVIGTHADGNRGVPPAFASLGSLPAVRDRRVHTVDGDLLFRPGPRVVDGMELLAALLHPEHAAVLPHPERATAVGHASAPDGGAR